VVGLRRAAARAVITRPRESIMPRRRARQRRQRMFHEIVRLEPGCRKARSRSSSSIRGRTARAPSCSSPTTWSPRCPHRAGTCADTSASRRATRGCGEKSSRTRPLTRAPTLRYRPPAISSSLHCRPRPTNRLRERGGHGSRCVPGRPRYVGAPDPLRCPGARRPSPRRHPPRVLRPGAPPLLRARRSGKAHHEQSRAELSQRPPAAAQSSQSPAASG
jgi:hypothetical protein